MEYKKRDVGSVKTYEEGKKEERQRFEQMTVLSLDFPTPLSES
jgi:hypothetical protein